MTNETKATREDVIAEIKTWASNGEATKIIRAKLTIAGIDDKTITSLIQEAGVGRNTAGFTQVNTLKFLEDGVTEYELYEKIIEEKAKNEARWISDRNKIRKTLNAVYDKLGSPIPEQAATDKQKEAIKKLLAK